MTTVLTVAEQDLLNQHDCVNREQYLAHLGLKTGDRVFIKIRLMNYDEIWVVAHLLDLQAHGVEVLLEQPQADPSFPGVGGHHAVVPLTDLKPYDALPKGLQREDGYLKGTYFVNMTVCVTLMANETTDAAKLMLARDHTYEFHKQLIPLVMREINYLFQAGALVDSIDSVELTHE